MLAEAIKSSGVDVLTTREPGGTEIAEEIRELLLKHRQEHMEPNTEMLLMFAARAQHLANVIKPALSEGKCVICDRFTDATYAYQGGGRGIYLQNILQLENLVQGDFRPDLTIILESTDIEKCLQRAKGVGTGDRIEIEKLTFFERANKIYLARAHGNPNRYKVFDAMQEIQPLHNAIVEVVDAHFTAS